MAARKKKKHLSSSAVVYRGSICSYCIEKLETNLHGTIVRHVDGTAYGFCAPALASKIRNISKKRKGKPHGDNHLS